MNSDARAGLVRTTPRRLGPNGPDVGPLALGLWRFTGSDVGANAALVEAGLDSGMNLVDLADVYGLDWGGTGFGSCEANLGAVLDARPELREQMVLATKGGIVPPLPYDSGAAALREACDASLQRLRTDRIDLYQIHRPDMFTHPAELADTLDGLIASGKVGAVGVSNYTPAQTRALAAHLDHPLVSTQPEFSAACLDPMRDGTLDLCAEAGVVPLAWSPLAGGRLMRQSPLAGRRLPSEGEGEGEGVRPELLETLDRLAEREGVDRAAVCLAFVLAHPTAPVAIVGTQRIDRLTAAQAALRVHLDRNDVYDVVEASEGVPLP
ncbi:aldo/keto reductase [Candidatus Poriferisodalis sp.]|uniref:aldo/keto reductase n=1 Tax=Candidatus Poriferisodalis sp. TaxID=3101277 RepID=UPI003B5A1787